MDISRLACITVTSLLLILVRIDENIANSIGNFLNSIPLPTQRNYNETDFKVTLDELGLLLPSPQFDSVDTSVQLAIAQFGVSFILITWGLRIYIEYKKLK